MPLKPQKHSQYINALKGEMPPDLLKREPGRLGYLLLIISVYAGGIYFIVWGESLGVKFLASLMLGLAIAWSTFLGHEILHDSVVKGAFWKNLLGGFCYLPWGLHPQAWVHWHDYHHATTNDGKTDPDSFGPFDRIERNKLAKLQWALSPGSGTIASYVLFPFFFSLKCFAMVFFFSKAVGAPGEIRRYRIHMALVLSLWFFSAAWLGWEGLLFGFFIPLALGNFIWISHIFTNHMLNPITGEVNDPLLNTLTVSHSWPMQKLLMDFGFHTEHHVFPKMNPRNAPRLAALLKKHWPERYNELPYNLALKRIFTSPRFYSDDHRLKDPRTGRVVDTEELLRPSS